MRLSLIAIASVIASQLLLLGSAYAGSEASTTKPYAEPLSSQTIDTLKILYEQLINRENAHDVEAVKDMVWNSPSTLFVAKTATPAEGNWAGFWGKEVVIAHFHDLYQGTFHMEPDYSREKVVGLTPDVAETYVPLKISVAYAGQNPVAKPFLMIVDWIRTPQGWRMATDIALPIPPPASATHS
jgi:hypothetical protein